MTKTHLNRFNSIFQIRFLKTYLMSISENRDAGFGATPSIFRKKKCSLNNYSKHSSSRISTLSTNRKFEAVCRPYKSKKSRTSCQKCQKDHRNPFFEDNNCQLFSNHLSDNTLNVARGGANAASK